MQYISIIQLVLKLTLTFFEGLIQNTIIIIVITQYLITDYGCYIKLLMNKNSGILSYNYSKSYHRVAQIFSGVVRNV